LWNKAIEQWFGNKEEIQESPILFPQDVRQIILQQNLIGWRQLFNDRFAVEWAGVQGDCFHNKVGPTNVRQNHSTRRQTGVQWHQKLMQEIWKQRGKQERARSRPKCEGTKQSRSFG
jgi:hypothetical protein